MLCLFLIQFYLTSPFENIIQMHLLFQPNCFYSFRLASLYHLAGKSHQKKKKMGKRKRKSKTQSFKFFLVFVVGHFLICPDNQTQISMNQHCPNKPTTPKTASRIWHSLKDSQNVKHTTKQKWNSCN